MILDDPATPSDPSRIIADLWRERDEALAQQAATAEVLQVINSSPGELAPVFDAMVEKAVRLCGAAFGAMMLRQDERFIGVAVRGMPEAYSEYLKHNPPAHGSDTAPVRILQGERFVHIVDLAAEDAYRMIEPRPGRSTSVVRAPTFQCRCARTARCSA